MTNIKDKPGGRPAKKRIEKQQRVVSTKLTELQYYAIRKRAGVSVSMSGRRLFRQRSYPG